MRRKYRIELPDNEIIEEYKNGKSTGELAIKYKTSHSVIKRRLYNSGIVTRSRKEYRGSKSKMWKGVGDMSSRYWSQVICSARLRNIEFSITKEYAWELFEKQNKKCSLSGLDIKFAESHLYDEQSASMDRIDSTKGYIEGNVQWVHTDINKMKNSFEESYFIQMCCLVANQFDNNGV